MKQIATVFRFEFKNYTKNKAYLILTILLVAAVGIALSIPRFQEMFQSGGKAETAEKKCCGGCGSNGNRKSGVCFVRRYSAG